MVQTPAAPRRRLPRVPADAVRFAGVGTVTFLVDLAVLAALRAWTDWPLPPAVATGYATAFALSFALNRVVTFRSHGPVRGQVGRWLVVVAGDFSLTVGGTTALAAAGVDVRLARLVPAACVASFTYSASRWWVFADRGAEGVSRPPSSAPPRSA